MFASSLIKGGRGDDVHWEGKGNKGGGTRPPSIDIAPLAEAVMFCGYYLLIFNGASQEQATGECYPSDKPTGPWCRFGSELQV